LLRKGGGMNSIGSLFSTSTWQSWSVSGASIVLGYQSEDSDLLGADFLSGVNTDLVTLSDEAQAVLDSRQGEDGDLASLTEDMSANQVASLSLTVSSGEVLSAMVGDLDSLDLLSGLTA
jgi:hypothetical protein